MSSEFISNQSRATKKITPLEENFKNKYGLPYHSKDITLGDLLNVCGDYVYFTLKNFVSINDEEMGWNVIQNEPVTKVERYLNEALEEYIGYIDTVYVPEKETAFLDYLNYKILFVGVDYEQLARFKKGEVGIEGPVWEIAICKDIHGDLIETDNIDLNSNWLEENKKYIADSPEQGGIYVFKPI